MSLNDIENIDLTEFDDLIKPKPQEGSTGVKKRLSQSGLGLFQRNIKSKPSEELHRQESSLQADSPSPSLSNLLPSTNQNNDVVISDSSQSTVSLQAEQSPVTTNIGPQSHDQLSGTLPLSVATSSHQEALIDRDVSISNYIDNSTSKFAQKDARVGINLDIVNNDILKSSPSDTTIVKNNLSDLNIVKTDYVISYQTKSDVIISDNLNDNNYLNSNLGTNDDADEYRGIGSNLTISEFDHANSKNESEPQGDHGGTDLTISKDGLSDLDISISDPSLKNDLPAKPRYVFYDKTEDHFEKPLDDDMLYHVEIKSRYILIDRIVLSTLKKIKHVSDKVIYLKLLRLSYGFGSHTTNLPIGPETLLRGTLIGRTKIKQSINNLIELGLIEKQKYFHTKGNTYKVYLDPQTRQEHTDRARQIAIDQNVLDVLPTVLDPGELIVFFYLYCESYGLNKNITKERIGYQSLVNDLGISRSSIKRHRDRLVSDRLIIPVTKENRDGTFYRVTLPHEVIKTEKNRPLLKFRSSGVKIADGSFLSVFKSNPSNDHERSNLNTSEMDIVKNEIDDGLNLNTAISGQQDSQTTKINRADVNGTDMTIAKSDPHNNKNNNKTSSEQGDDVFNFFNQESKHNPEFNFAITRKKISNLLEQHKPDYLKSTFSKMLPAMMRDGVTNPVGLYLHALETPESYAMLQKPSAQELADKKRIENQIELREKSFTDEFKRIIDSKQETFWNGLDECIREESLAKRRTEMGPGGELKIPEVAIKRSAIERTFWERHNQAWQSLPAEERAMLAARVKQTIIKRVYAGEGGAVPSPMPERDFWNSLDEYAEKLAMISAGKGK